MPDQNFINQLIAMRNLCDQMILQQGGTYEHQPDLPLPPSTPTDVPTPQTGESGALADFYARARVGQLCAWARITSAEVDALNLKYGVNRVAQQIAFYGPSSGGGIGVISVVMPTSISATGYGFWKFDPNEELVPDVGGAGDQWVATMATRQGKPVIAPLM